MDWTAGESQTAQERAESQLPVCFELLELVIEALAETEEDGTDSEATTGSDVAGARTSTLTAVEAGVEAVLQYLEQVSAEPSAGRAALPLAGVRLLGRCGCMADCLGAVNCPTAGNRRGRGVRWSGGPSLGSKRGERRSMRDLQAPVPRTPSMSERHLERAKHPLPHGPLQLSSSLC